MNSSLSGLAMVLSHNVWLGSALPVIVALIGWLSPDQGPALVVPVAGGAREFFLRGFIRTVRGVRINCRSYPFASTAEMNVLVNNARSISMKRGKT
jgi:hypothetical protein